MEEADNLEQAITDFLSSLTPESATGASDGLMLAAQERVFANLSNYSTELMAILGKEIVRRRKDQQGIIDELQQKAAADIATKKRLRKERETLQQKEADLAEEIEDLRRSHKRRRVSRSPTRERSDPDNGKRAMVTSLRLPSPNVTTARPGLPTLESLAPPPEPHPPLPSMMAEGEVSDAQLTQGWMDLASNCPDVWRFLQLRGLADPLAAWHACGGDQQVFLTALSTEMTTMSLEFPMLTVAKRNQLNYDENISKGNYNCS